jgi:hypothetical protein
MQGAKKIGLSRREMEWAVQGALRHAPGDPGALARHLVELMMTLIEKNNAAIAGALVGSGEPQDDDERGRP